MNPVLFDFSDPHAVTAWHPINDGVMGGVSSSQLRHEPTGHAVFTGQVSLDNNGGFTSVRCRPGELGRAGVAAYLLRVCGDGKRYKDRGPIQLTGRANYRKYGQQLGIDFENNPEIVAIPSIGLMVACKFWADNGLNLLADQDDVRAVTRRINGGYNGFEDRKSHLAKLQSWV